ncbi:MAG: hypothetical protein ACR2QQ_10480, partial [Gammaproteobacteria bacterium]
IAILPEKLTAILVAVRTFPQVVSIARICRRTGISSGANIRGITRVIRAFQVAGRGHASGRAF